MYQKKSRVSRRARASAAPAQAVKPGAALAPAPAAPAPVLHSFANLALTAVQREDDQGNWFSRGINWAEAKEHDAVHWVANKVQGVPVLGKAANQVANKIDAETHFLGGEAKGAGRLVGRTVKKVRHLVGGAMRGAGRLRDRAVKGTKRFASSTMREARHLRDKADHGVDWVKAKADHGVDWVEAKERRATRWAAKRTKKIPVLGAAVSLAGRGLDAETDAAGQLAKGAGSLAGGIAHGQLHPLKTRDTIDKGVSWAENQANYGVDWVEAKEHRATRWAAKKTRKVPVVGALTEMAAQNADAGTQLVGGVAKGAVGLVGGVAHAVLHPVSTVAGLETVAEHIPGSGDSLKAAHGLLNVALGQETMEQVSQSLDPLQSSKDDGRFFKRLWNGIAAPYEQAIKDGKPMEAVGRGGFDLATLVGPGGVSKVIKLAGVAKAARLAKVAKLADATKATEVAGATNAVDVVDATNAADATNAVPAAAGTANAVPAARIIPPALPEPVVTAPTAAASVPSFGGGVPSFGAGVPAEVADSVAVGADAARVPVAVGADAARVPVAVGAARVPVAVGAAVPEAVGAARVPVAVGTVPAVLDPLGPAGVGTVPAASVGAVPAVDATAAGALPALGAGVPAEVAPALSEPAVAAPTVMGATKAPEPASKVAEDLEMERVMKAYDALGDEPKKVSISANDKDFEKSDPKPHTLERHSSDIPLERNGVPAGDRNIEGRIYGDPPWDRAETASYKWNDHTTMNQTVNDYLRDNWEQVRSDLALKHLHSATFRTKSAVGEGYYNGGQHGLGPRKAVYGQTSLVTITIVDVPSDPSAIKVVTAFPNGKGF